MFENYLKTALRNLLRNKFYSLINIAGLAIGITACILIMLYVQSEFSYDKFHKNADRIYRVNLYAVLSDNEFNTPTTSVPLAEIMQEEKPCLVASSFKIRLLSPACKSALVILIGFL